jgi:hypothetical protein
MKSPITPLAASTRHADRRRAVSERHCPVAHDLWPDVSRADKGIG